MLIRLDLEQPHHAGLELRSLMAATAKQLGVPLEDVLSLEVVRRALDARARRTVPTWRLTLDVNVKTPPSRGMPAWKAIPNQPETKALLSPRISPDAGPIVVIGAGPAGLFCAWHLAEQGAKVLLVERGKPVETRARDFGQFRGRGQLNPESNICFGEGGAGTYSDGKLYTRKKDKLIPEVLSRMVQCGAPEAILIDAKPHIGTNLLFRMLQNIRQQLREHGVKLFFEQKFTKLRTRAGKIIGVELANGDQIDAERVVLAIGHSARDTFEQLLAQNVPMEAKPFAVGVRAEHPQYLIDNAQYRLKGGSHRLRPPTLPPADYRLTAQTNSNRGVWSFCMCPGGMIIPSSTEPNMLVVNGMSSARRSTPFANSGLVVQVSLGDLANEGFGTGPLAGMAFQRVLERNAFTGGGGGYFAPAMRASDLVAKRPSQSLAATHFRPGLTPCDLRHVLPKFVWKSLAEGLLKFDRTIHGYSSSEANLIAVESRTSSPIRIPRDPESGEVDGFAGLYVAGEGPGYAGGIMSAAIDGLRTAEKILQSSASKTD